MKFNQAIDERRLTDSTITPSTGTMQHKDALMKSGLLAKSFSYYLKTLLLFINLEIGFSTSAYGGLIE